MNGKRVVLGLGLLVAAFWLVFPRSEPVAKNAPRQGRAAIMEKAAGVFSAAYPDAGMSIASQEEGAHIVLGGARLLFSPWGGCPPAPSLDFPEDAPLCAVFEQAYPAGAGGRNPAAGFDPGRVRNEKLLRLLYGDSAKEVEANLVAVNFLGETLRFSSRQGAAAALARVAARLERIILDDPSAREWILPTGGTYAWRRISKSPRLSAHSFGVCIDLNIEKGLYWQWNPSPEDVARTRGEYPQSVVEAFESEGFVWGGKWSAFDFMHFEYRPELLLGLSGGARSALFGASGARQ